MNMNEWRSFLTESKQEPDKLLREITEDELSHIQKALDEMDTSDLAFDKIFNGKSRVLIDFQAADSESRIGKFFNFFAENGYKVDWSKGLIYGEQELRDNSSKNLAALLSSGEDSPDYIKPQKKKIQMKIGKYFKKVTDLLNKRDAIFQKIVAWSKANNPLGSYPLSPARVSGNLKRYALSEQDQLNYNRIESYIGLYVPDTPSYQLEAEQFVNMAKYWAENADFIKKKIKSITNDKYSIVITRHPIDVLRMSDFDQISSCHSPPSRGSGESYYKCAVAEAHGHGAVAYVVETEHLREHIGGKQLSLEQIESQIQDEELFEDDKRYQDSGTVEPVSRLRLRQVRYYEATKDSKPKTNDYKKADRNPFDGIQLAVPEQRVYGDKIPGFRNRVMRWVREAQQEQMNIVKKDSEPNNEERVIQLGKFIKFGGSYEDNHISSLIADLFGNGKFPANTSGRVTQDTATEDAIDSNLVSGLIGQYAEEVENIADRWNNRYQAVEVSGVAEDDGGGSVYISLNAQMEIKWDVEEFRSPPDRQSIGYAVDEINDYGYGYFNSDYSESRISRSREFIIYIPINIEMIPNSNGMGFAIDPDEFEDYCVGLNQIDDYYDGIKNLFTMFFKREGFLEGGVFLELAREAIDGDVDTEWDVETDDRYDYDEVTEITAQAEFDFGAFEPELPEVNSKILLAIAQDQDWLRELRVKFHNEAQAKLETEYFVDTTWDTRFDSSGDLILSCSLTVRDHHPDKVVELMREIITENFDLDDLRDAVVRPWLLQALNSRMPSSMQQNLDENERIVKSWKSFLRG